MTFCLDPNDQPHLWFSQPFMITEPCLNTLAEALDACDGTTKNQTYQLLARPRECGEYKALANADVLWMSLWPSYVCVTKRLATCRPMPYSSLTALPPKISCKLLYWVSVVVTSRILKRHSRTSLRWSMLDHSFDV